MRRTAALIVGGGPAGATAAIRLAQGGLAPLLIERDRETGDALCGGFLSWRTLAALDRVGVPRAALGGHGVGCVRLFAGGRMVEASLPGGAIGVSRHRLDSTLLAAARAAGAGIEQGVLVRAIEGTTARTADGALVAGGALLLASGKHDIRGAARPAPRDRDPAMGLRLRLPPAAALGRMIGDAVELHMFRGGYAGLVAQEDGSANLCMAVRRSRLRAAGDPHALFLALARECPALGDRLGHAAPGGGIDAVANVPYGWHDRATRPGVFRLGDQAGVIPSLAGEGIGIAIASGLRASCALLRDGPAGAGTYQARLDAALTRPIGIAGMVRALAERPAGAALLLAGARLHPGLVRSVAKLTRVRESPIDDPPHRQHI